MTQRVDAECALGVFTSATSVEDVAGGTGYYSFSAEDIPQSQFEICASTLVSGLGETIDLTSAIRQRVLQYLNTNGPTKASGDERVSGLTWTEKESS